LPPTKLTPELPRNCPRIAPGSPPKTPPKSPRGHPGGTPGSPRDHPEPDVRALRCASGPACGLSPHPTPLPPGEGAGACGEAFGDVAAFVIGGGGDGDFAGDGKFAALQHHVPAAALGQRLLDGGFVAESLGPFLGEVLEVLARELLGAAIRHYALPDPPSGAWRAPPLRFVLP